MKKSVKLIALVMAVALVLCACGGPASSTPASTPADSTPAASTPASTPENNQATTPTNAGDPVYGGDLSVLGFQFNTFFLPHSTTTMVLGWTFITSSSSFCWQAGIFMSARSKPSLSMASVIPMKTTAALASFAVFTASAISPSSGS